VRLFRRLTRVQLASISGVSYARIVAYERGMATPHRNTRLKLAKALGTRDLGRWRDALSLAANDSPDLLRPATMLRGARTGEASFGSWATGLETRKAVPCTSG
jgi:transcriptional regulator with XRE-family HTH domain